MNNLFINVHDTHLNRRHANEFGRGLGIFAVKRPVRAPKLQLRHAAQTPAQGEGRAFIGRAAVGTIQEARST